jgi:hypothetical protein
MIALLNDMSHTRGKEMREYAASRRLAAKARAGRNSAGIGRRGYRRRVQRSPARRHLAQSS